MWRFKVSIVSIQTDQSRQGLLTTLCDAAEHTFQSYQSKQINPDMSIATTVLDAAEKFQSYQSKQINPDFFSVINNLVSIP